MAIINIITFISEFRLCEITNTFCPPGIFTTGLFLRSVAFPFVPSGTKLH
jgi:hypothetical protein